MDFHEFLPAFDHYHRMGLRWTREEFLSAIEKEVGSHGYDKWQHAAEIGRFEAEHCWWENDAPYFKVWPNLVPELCSVNVDLPADFLKVPFEAFVIRLPKEYNDLKVDADHVVRSVLVIEDSPEDAAHRSVWLWMDIGETVEGLPMLHWCTLKCGLGQSIEKALAVDQSPDLPGARIPNEVKHRCLRLAVSICFLATGEDRILDPDVLGKDFRAYIEARDRGDTERVRVIVDRAVRRKKLGWNVGLRERLRPLTSEPSDPSEATGASLSHQHQRRAHFRMMSSGKVVFIRQTTVRPDLPPPERAPGYGLR